MAKLIEVTIQRSKWYRGPGKASRRAGSSCNALLVGKDIHRNDPTRKIGTMCCLGFMCLASAKANVAMRQCLQILENGIDPLTEHNEQWSGVADDVVL